MKTILLSNSSKTGEITGDGIANTICVGKNKVIGRVDEEIKNLSTSMNLTKSKK